MTIAIVGSRTGMHWGDVTREIRHLLSRGLVARVVSGGASGVDSVAEHVATESKIPVTSHRPDWQRLGRGAGFARNKTIVEDSDAVYAFWNGVSRGTLSTIEYAKKLGKPVHVWTEGKWT